MRSNRFIATPIHTQKYANYIEESFDQDQTWQRRARKLRDRRWRKLTTRMTLADKSG